MTDARAPRIAAVIFAVGLYVWGGLAPRAAHAEPCVTEPSSADSEGDPAALRDRARDLDDHGQPMRAAAIRAFIVKKWPDDPSAKEAGVRAVGSLAKVDVSTCLEPVAALANEIESRICSTASSDPECAGIARFVDDVVRLRAEALVARSQKAEGDTARKLLLDAGATYEALFARRLRGPCERGEPRCHRADEVLFNAAHAYRAGHDLDSAFRSLELLANPRFRFGGELVSKGIFDEGNMHFAIASYEQAASFFERFAGASPKSEAAPTALSDAIVLRASLGDLDRAREDAARFEKLFGAKKSGDNARFAVAIGREIARRGTPDDVIAFVEPRMAMVQKAAPEWGAELSMVLVRAYRATKRGRDAKALAEKVASIDAGAGVAKNPEDANELAIIGRRLTAIGEARVFLADEASGGALDSVTAKGDEKALEKKKRAVDDAERRYARVFELPLSPPGPTVDAAASIARLRSRLWAQTFLALGEEGAKSAFSEALAVNRRCLDLSIKLQYRTDRAVACERWLLRHDRGETKPNQALPPRLFRSTQDAMAPSPDRVPPPGP